MYFPDKQNFNLIDRYIKCKDLSVVKRITKHNIIVYCEKMGYCYPDFAKTKSEQLEYLKAKYVEYLFRTRKVLVV